MVQGSRVVPDTELARYPANYFAGYRASKFRRKKSIKKIGKSLVSTKPTKISGCYFTLILYTLNEKVLKKLAFSKFASFVQ